MAIIKLAKGDHFLVHITSVVRDVPSSYGPEVKFVGQTATDPDVAIFLKPETAERQLGRIGLTLDSVVGQTVEFAKPDKYIDINRVGAHVAAPSAPLNAPNPPASNGKQAFTSGPHVPGLDPEPAPVGRLAADRDEQLKKLFALYDKCFDHAALTSKRLKAVDIQTTHEGIAAQTATLYIACKERGLA